MSMKSLATTSVALLLATPFAASADKPVPVTVVNPVVPVELRNADPISVIAQPSSLDPTGFMTLGGGFSTAPGATLNGQALFDSDVVLTGLMVQLRAGGSTSTCIVSVAARDQNGAALISALFFGEVGAGESLISPFIPVPNVALPAGSYLHFSGANDTDGTCGVRFVAQSLKR